MMQAPQVTNLQQQPNMVGRKKMSTMVAPEYEPKLLYMQVFAPLETVILQTSIVDIIIKIFKSKVFQ